MITDLVLMVLNKWNVVVIRSRFEKFYSVHINFLVARLFLLIMIKLDFVESMGFLIASLIVMKYLVTGVTFFPCILADCKNAYFKKCNEQLIRITLT